MGNNELIKIIKQQIELNKSIGISQFINLVLYHQDYGYYSSNINEIGIKGDFVTSVTSSLLFAKCLITQINQLFGHNLQRNIIEFGAGNGQLMLDILSIIGNDIEYYYIIEPSQKLVAIQQSKLKTHYPNFYDKVVWLNDYNIKLEGVIIANEVLDAMGCNQYQLLDGVLYENKITLENNNLVIRAFKVQNNNILHKIKPYGLESGFIFEWGVESIDKFLSICNQILLRGCVLIIDYGYSEKELYTKKHKHGTLRGFKNHQLVDDILSNIGIMDITYSINFTQVAELAIQNKFDIIDYTNQANFLLNCNLLGYLDKDINSTQYLIDTNLVNRLTSINQMGEVFKVIALSKNYDFYDWLGFKVGTLANSL